MPNPFCRASFFRIILAFWWFWQTNWQPLVFLCFVNYCQPRSFSKSCTIMLILLIGFSKKIKSLPMRLLLLLGAHTLVCLRLGWGWSFLMYLLERLRLVLLSGCLKELLVLVLILIMLVSRLEERKWEGKNVFNFWSEGSMILPHYHKMKVITVIWIHFSKFQSLKK